MAHLTIGLLGECSHEESSINRRNLARRGRCISNDALKKNNAPRNRGKANPYSRGCSIVTHCARFTD
ncbi:hypothetical protein JHK82_037656 [Glycine max]|uniref:Uncharacterized protein n=1 Tax=Glycine max TaxID=3847 RepID=K7M2N5_SOYBN|nr:hypothetical protein JHK87_037610 [Glycine soja]KAG4971987.1 hypothetical protein JHK85_038408 [Glycine max]KAG4978380.1 hypothetical protein JHK86_037854 [Glycine max]KAG5114387.1 hypothetical protein JHK82_037656 [Glycine max]KAG5131670.1 hypothetical protein JHK84_038067 [Glycine max]